MPVRCAFICARRRFTLDVTYARRNIHSINTAPGGAELEMEMARSKFADRYYDAETGLWSAEFEAFFDAVMAATSADFDGNQICDALGNGLTVEQAVAEIEQTDMEEREDYARMRSSIDTLDHDYSMNA